MSFDGHRVEMQNRGKAFWIRFDVHDSADSSRHNVPCAIMARESRRVQNTFSHRNTSTCGFNDGCHLSVYDSSILEDVQELSTFQYAPECFLRKHRQRLLRPRVCQPASLSQPVKDI